MDCWEDAIARHANEKLAQGLPVTVSGILWEALGVAKANHDPKAEARVKATLLRLGWTLDRPRLDDGTRPRRYVKNMPTAANEPMPGAGTSAAVG